MYTISSKDVRYSSKIHYGGFVCTMSSMDMFHDHTVYISLDYKRDIISNLCHGVLDMYGNKYTSLLEMEMGKYAQYSTIYFVQEMFLWNLDIMK